MALDHEAIYEAYKSEAKPVVSIDDSSGAFDADGNKVTLDDAKIAAARKTLDDAAAAIFYRSQRTGAAGTTDTIMNETILKTLAIFYRSQRTGAAGTTDTIYASIGDQLDMQYKDAVNGTTTWKDHVAAVKAKYPKPS